MQIKDYLHFYPNCEVYYEPIPGVQVLTLKWLDKLIDKGLTHLVKPILRSLSDMTPEEAIEFVRLNEYSYYGDFPPNRTYTTYRNSFGMVVVKWGHTTRELFIPQDKRSFKPNEFAYLLKQDFDLFCLIEHGLAVDKTKIK